MQVKAGRVYPELSTVPFIQQVLPLVLEELDIDQEMAQLVHASKNMKKAVVLFTNSTSATSNDSILRFLLFDSLSEVFCSWANLRVSTLLPASKKHIHELIDKTCRTFEGEDMHDEMVEDEYDDEEEEYEDWYADKAPDFHSIFSDDQEEDDDWDTDSAPDFDYCFGDYEEDGIEEEEEEENDDFDVNFLSYECVSLK